MPISTRLPATRWGAFVGHLLLSLLILIVLSALIAFVLFPGALFKLAGGIDGIKIIAGVDMVLGPLLTLVIYNRSKPLNELARDLIVIATIQIAALGAGMYIVYNSRPAVVTYAFDQFYTSKVDEFVAQSASAPTDLNLLSPTFFNLTLPTDDDEARSRMVEIEFSGTSPRFMTDEFEPLSTDQDALATQLRLGLDRPESIEQRCIERTLQTAFDTAQVCFHPGTRRFSELTEK
ncbi:MAG: hypothetical protein AAF465_00140 [Pseudomonadota bacterium]